MLGHGLILAGAWSIEATGSMLPMALAASAAVMLSLPLLRTLTRREARIAPRHNQDR
ncbi:MAG: hypothetical protein RLZZ618_1245 [Pseudomonadota bacterium]|jgi:hypothetical protein